VDRFSAISAQVLRIVKSRSHDHPRIWGGIFQLTIETNLLILIEATQIPAKRREEVHIIVIVFEDGGRVDVAVEPINFKQLLPLALVQLSQRVGVVVAVHEDL
jgi:hypothetical protein